MFLIKKSTGFDENIKFEENVNLDKKSNLTKQSNLTKMSMFPPPPPPPPILWMWYLIFSGPKRNFGKPKGSRLYHGIVTVLIWMLNWQHQQLQGENILCGDTSTRQFIPSHPIPTQQMAHRFRQFFTILTKFDNSDKKLQFPT